MVAAAHAWDEPMERMRVRPAHAHSYERLCVLRSAGAGNSHGVSIILGYGD